MSVRLVKLARLFISTPNSQQWRNIAPPGQKACELHGMVLVQEEDIRYQGVQRYRLTHPDIASPPVNWVCFVCAHPDASGVRSFFFFFLSLRAGTAPKGVVARRLLKRAFYTAL